MITLLLTALALDPCSLLDAKSIAQVQGAVPTQTKASEHPDGPFTGRQCFFTLPEFVKSISFEVTQPNPGTRPAELRKRWAQLSGKDKERERELEREEKDKGKAGARGEEDEEGKPPKPVRGVGKGAVWIGDARVGALYVLAPTAIVRVSVGGAGDEPSKIKACSALARNALQNLLHPKKG